MNHINLINLRRVTGFEGEGKKWNLAFWPYLVLHISDAFAQFNGQFLARIARYERCWPQKRLSCFLKVLLTARFFGDQRTSGQSLYMSTTILHNQLICTINLTYLW